MNVEGDIIYLGTMQNKDSVYTGLPARGVTVRLMPGRYPALGEDKYGPLLDPDIRAEMEADPSLRTGGGLLGNLGKPTDPERYDEEALREKELDNGPEGFALHYLLDTSLSDALKFQLKTRDLMLLDCPQDRIPLDVMWFGDREHQVTLDASLGLQAAYIQEAMVVDGFGFEPPKGIWCAIDPAGQGGDETVLMAGCSVGRTIHILDMDAFRGGLGPDTADRILHFFRRNKVEFVYVEKNMGHGLFGLGLRNLLQGTDQEHLASCITEEYSTGQKEKRIIETLRPLMERHRICIHRRVLDQDMKLLLVYGIQERRVFSLMHQLTNITVDRGSLLHDDRLDALAMLVSRLAPAVMNDPLKQVEEAEEAKVRDWLENPLGMPWIEHQTPQQLQHMEWDW
jgi:putative DNA maturase B